MYEYPIVEVSAHNTIAESELDSLLEAEGIHRDKNLDYRCAMLDENGCAIATGSCFGNTLRCFAVNRNHQGEGLLNRIVTHLIEVQFARGNMHLFLFTKVDTAKFFADLGFYEIVRIDGSVVFMENRRDGFANYLRSLSPGRCEGKSAAIVMNANPFTLGHQYLAETAAANCDTLHIFLVSEDVSIIPFAVRKELVRLGTGHLPNVQLHDGGPYIISNATFPSYFLRDEIDVIRNHAELDLKVFTKIAPTLNITTRYVGEEHHSLVTNMYNLAMLNILPAAGIDCVVIPRKLSNQAPISASTVRLALHQRDWTTLRSLLPETTLSYFQSDKASTVLAALDATEDLVHY